MWTWFGPPSQAKSVAEQKNDSSSIPSVGSASARRRTGMDSKSPPSSEEGAELGALLGMELGMLEGVDEGLADGMLEGDADGANEGDAEGDSVSFS